MWRAALLGVVTGMRSQLPTALLAYRARKGQFPYDVSGPGNVLRRTGSVPLAVMAAAGELIGDKLPRTPNRLEDGPLMGRVTLGAAAGAGIASAFGRSRVLGAVAGAAGAAAGTAAGHRLRVAAVERMGMSDTVAALVEDVLAITLGLIATRPGAADAS